MDNSFNCAFCKKTGEYLDFKENIITCYEHNHNKDSKKINFILKKINNHSLNYINIHSYYILISGFNIINSEVIRILYYLYLNPLEKEKYLYFFPNKNKSNEFGKKILNQDNDFYVESKFTRFFTLDNKEGILFNFDKIKSGEEVMFLIELLKTIVDSKQVKDHKLLFHKNLYNLKKEYNSKFNIEFMLTPNKDELKNLDLLANIDLNLFQEYINYNSLVLKFENQTFFYVIDYLERMYLPAFKNNLEKPYHLDQFIWNLSQLVILGIFLSLKFPKEKIQKINDKINLIWSNEIWTEEKRPLLTYYKSYLEYLSNKLKIETFENYQDFSNMLYYLNLNLIKLIPRFLSIPELRVYWDIGHSISEKLQISQGNYKSLLFEINEFIIFTSKIIEDNYFHQHIMIFLHEIYHIWNTLAIISKKEEYFIKAILAHNKLNEMQKTIGQKVHFEIGLDKNYSYNEQIMDEISLGNLYFNFNNEIKYKEIIFNLKKYLSEDNVDEFTKLTITSLLFFSFEDYESLKELHRHFANYNHTKSIYAKLDINRNNSIKYFAEGFYNLDIIEKEKLYLKAIVENEHAEVMLGSLNKDLTEKNIFRAFYKMFIFLEKALFEENIYIINTNLMNALNESESILIPNITRESTYYYMLKCKITLLFLNNNFLEIQKELLNFKKFDFKSSNYFIEIMNKIINFELNKEFDEIGKLFFLIEKKENDDIWLKIIQKIYINNLQKSFSENKQHINKIQHMSDMSLLMVEFINIVEIGCIKAFWKNSTTIKQNNPEDIGKSLLYTFLSSLKKFHLFQESEINFYKIDLLAIQNKQCYLFETKIYYNKQNYEDGFSQIKKKYYDYLKKDNYDNISPYYVVFDDRKNKEEMPKEIEFEGIKIKIIQIHIAKNY